MTTETVLAALYLRGAPRPADPPRRGWPEILAALRREGADDAVSVLRGAGMSSTATILQANGLLDWAQEAVDAGAALTAASEGYPLRWFETLGEGAPPALWREGRLPAVAWVGAVGSREVGEDIRGFMAEIGLRGVGLGRGIVSGGAVGCDAAAEAAALAAGGPVLRLLPHGLSLRTADDGAIHLSLASTHEPFSRALAMERNALIYAAADATVVGHARLRQGGTWHGAADALRRRLGRLLVRDDEGAAARALRSLGAEGLGDPADLSERLAAKPTRRNLFAYERRRYYRRVSESLDVVHDPSHPCAICGGDRYIWGISRVGGTAWKTNFVADGLSFFGGLSGAGTGEVRTRMCLGCRHLDDFVSGGSFPTG